MGIGKHVYKMDYWQAASGSWHCNDIKNICGKSCKWYVPMRMLNLSIEEYITLLIKYNAQNVFYYEPTDYLGFSFKTEKDVKSFCAYVNHEAVKRKYYCY